MEALWPELEASAAGANLRKAVHFARAAIGATVLSVRNELVGLEALVEVDVEAFMAALEEGRLDDAIDLYAGELLPEDRFEPWSDEPRERLIARYLRALADAATASEQRGQPDRAILLLSRLVAVDPLDEGAQRRLMALHAAIGDRHLALRQFRQLERALREDLALDPSPASRSLFEAIASGRDTGSLAPRGGQRRSGEAPPEALARPGDKVASERRLVTAISVGTPTAAVASTVTRVLESWGATTVPDEASVLGLFGVPLLGEDDAERALRAALEIVERDATVRVGAATGEAVLVPDPAPREDRASDAAPARLAALLRRVATPGVPLATTRTARAAGRRILLGGVQHVVGSRPGLLAVDVIGIATDDEPTAADAPLIGRQAEVAAILAFAAEVGERRAPRLLVVSGSAGVGKSRLVREVSSGLVGMAPAFRVLRGRSLAGGRGATYWALGEVLRDACGISLADSPQAMERALRDVAASILGGLPPEDRVATVAALATSAGIRLPDNPLEGRKPEEVSRALGVAWPRFAAGLADAGPTVLVLEDLHWASPELVEMVELIVSRASGPLLVLVTARPELRDADPGFGASVDASTIALGPLSQRESADLVGHLAGDSPMDPVDRARVLDRAEGNPFYLEQLTTHLRDAGREGLPDTLQSLLGARLDALGTADRRVLQEAAVVGRSFWVQPLEAALPGERIVPRLALLERKRFVVRRPVSTLPGHDEYAFRHALLHDVAYRSIPRTRRARAHARAGAWLEGIAGARADEVGDLLAHHFEAALGSTPTDAAEASGRAALREKAIDYLVRAGEGARRRFALDRAVDLHRRALGLAVDDRHRLRVLEALSEDHDAGFHGDDAALTYREALAIARRAGSDGEVVARLARKLAWLMVWNPGAFRASPDPAQAESLLEEGLRAQPGPLERGWLILVRGTAARLYRGSEPFGQGGRLDPRPLRDRIADVDEALAIARDLRSEELAAAAAHARGMLYGLEGRFRDMLELSRSEVDRLPPDASSLERSDALRRLAVNLINIEGDFEAGIELGRQSRALAGDANPHQLMHTLWPIVAGLYQLGRWEEVADLAQQDEAAFRLEPAIECQFVRDGPVIVGAALAMLGRTVEGHRLAALAGDPLADRLSASAWQARFATLTGRPEIARAISADKALEHRAYGPQHAYALVEALEALEDWLALTAFLPHARTSIAGNAALSPLLDRALGRARVAAGDLPAARRLLRRSAAAFGRLGMLFEAVRAAAALDATAPQDRPPARPHDS
jgi:DNA-binding SARP family transcriptional activator